MPLAMTRRGRTVNVEELPELDIQFEPPPGMEEEAPERRREALTPREVMMGPTAYSPGPYRGEKKKIAESHAREMAREMAIRDPGDVPTGLGTADAFRYRHGMVRSLSRRGQDRVGAWHASRAWADRQAAVPAGGWKRDMAERKFAADEKERDIARRVKAMEMGMSVGRFNREEEEAGYNRDQRPAVEQARDVGILAQIEQIKLARAQETRAQEQETRAQEKAVAEKGDRVVSQARTAADMMGDIGKRKIEAERWEAEKQFLNPGDVVEAKPEGGARSAEGGARSAEGRKPEGGGNMVRMRSPDGKVALVGPDRVEYFRKKGAVVVE